MNLKMATYKFRQLKFCKENYKNIVSVNTYSLPARKIKNFNEKFKKKSQKKKKNYVDTYGLLQNRH